MCSSTLQSASEQWTVNNTCLPNASKCLFLSHILYGLNKPACFSFRQGLNAIRKNFLMVIRSEQLCGHTHISCFEEG